MTETLNRMGEGWWSWVGAMAWQVALLALVVWLIDLVLRRRGWPQVRYALWALVLVKLFIPPTFALPSSVVSRVLPGGEQAVAVAAPVRVELPEPAEPAAFQPMDRAVSAVPQAEPLVASLVPAEPPAPASRPSLSLKASAMLGSGTVSLLLLAWLICRALRLRRLILADSTKITPDWINGVVACCARRLGLRAVPPVVVTEGVKSAAVFGIFRPVLLLPVQALEDASAERTCPPKPEGRRRMEHIMLHELAHVKRGDLVMNTAQALVQVAFWFHPAVWLAGMHLRHLRELCCDASVSRLLRERTSEYRETLVDAARRMIFGTERPGLGLLGLFENASRLRQRLHHLEKPSWKHRRLKVIASLAAAALMVALIVPMARMARAESSLLESLQSGAGEARGRAAWRLLESCQQGRVSARDAERIAQVLLPRLGSAADRLTSRTEAGPSIYGSEIALAWGLITNDLVAQSTAIELAHNLGAARCQYVPGTGAHIELRGRLMRAPVGVVMHRVLRVRGIDGQAVDERGLELFILLHRPSPVTWSHREPLALTPAPARSLAVEVDTAFYQLPPELMDALPASARSFSPEKIALVREALGGTQARKLVAYTDHALLTAESGWQSALALEPDEASPPAERPRKYAGTLPNGVTVELVGVSYHPSQGEQWWRPDGTTLAEAPYDKMDGSVSGGPGDPVKAYEFALRTGNTTNGIASVRCRFEPNAGSSASDGSPGKGEGELTNVRAIAATLPEGASRCTMRVGVAGTAWQTLASADGKGSASMGGNLGSAAFSDAYEVDGEVRIVVTADQYGADYRVLATTRSGQTRSAAGTSFSRVGGAVQIAAAFPGLRREDVQAFSLQTRLFQRVEFRNVSLEPGHRTDVQVVEPETEIIPIGTSRVQPKILETVKKPQELTFGPVIERTVRGSRQRTGCYIDFDTGGLLSPPSQDTPGDAVAFSAWIQEDGIDAVGIASESERRLGGFHLVALPVANERWNTSPLEVARTVSGASPAPVTHMRASQDLPATFFIKTREGGIGIVQIQDNGHRRAEELSVRFQMLSARAAEGAAEAVSADPSIRLVAVANLKTGKTVDEHGNRILDMPEGPAVPDPERLEAPLVIWVDVTGGDRKSLVDWSLADRESGRYLGGGGSQRHHTYETEDGTRVYRAALQMRLPLDVAAALELRARVAAGNWYQVGDAMDVQELEKHLSRPDTPVYTLSIDGIAVTNLREAGDGAQITLAVPNSIWRQRVFWARATRIDGEAVEPLAWNPGTETVSVVSFTFSRQKLSQLDSITVLQRPAHDMAIDLPTPSVSATSTEVEQETEPGKLTFGPVIERVVGDEPKVPDCTIDLDSGVLYTFPVDLKFDDESVLAWCRKNGVDAIGEVGGTRGGLGPVDAAVISATTEMWAASSAEIRKQIASEPAAPFDTSYMMRTAKDEVPATWLFRTREGGMGILQIVGFTEDPKGVKIRYKMVREAAGDDGVGQSPTSPCQPAERLVQALRAEDQGAVDAILESHRSFDYDGLSLRYDDFRDGQTVHPTLRYVQDERISYDLMAAMAQVTVGRAGEWPTFTLKDCRAVCDAGDEGLRRQLAAAEAQCKVDPSRLGQAGREARFALKGFELRWGDWTLTARAVAGAGTEAFTISGPAATLGNSDPPLRLVVTAQRATYSPETGTVSFRGSVEARRGNLQLTADELTVKRPSHAMVIDGRFVLRGRSIRAGSSPLDVELTGQGGEADLTQERLAVSGGLTVVIRNLSGDILAQLSGLDASEIRGAELVLKCTGPAAYDRKAGVAELAQFTLSIGGKRILKGDTLEVSRASESDGRLRIKATGSVDVRRQGVTLQRDSIEILCGPDDAEADITRF